MDWLQSERWHIDGYSFRVEVWHWKSNIETNHWNVYAYLYEGHVLFDELSKTQEQYPYTELPLHCGCTFFAKHWNSERTKIKSVQIGSDYAHYGDDFTLVDTKERAWIVFNDAEELAEYLIAITSKPKQLALF